MTTNPIVPQPPSLAPVAWIIFAEFEGKMVMQYPAYYTPEDAKTGAAMYVEGTKLEIRELYDFNLPALLNKERSYHDVVVHFAGKSVRLFDASYGLKLTCTRVGGWELWNTFGGKTECLAGEYGGVKLAVEVDGVMICGVKNG